MKSKKKIFLSILAIGLVGTSITINLNPNILNQIQYQSTQKDTQKSTLSQAEQSSLIETEKKAVESNAKPVDVIGGIQPRYSKLSVKNQALTADLIYTAVQNASYYYNSANQLLQGEIEYNRGESNNSLSAGLKSAWVEGYIKDLKNQSLVPNSLNNNFILALPNFSALREILNLSELNKADEFKELSLLIEVGKKTQENQTFSNNEKENGSINFNNAIKNYNLLIDATKELYTINQNSKYLSDIASLARIYHDIALGLVQTEEVKLQKDGSYKLSKNQLKAIKELTSSKDLTMSEDAKVLQKAIDSSKNKDSIPASTLKELADKSQKEFGTSVYWQSTSDLATVINQQIKGEEDEQKETEKQKEETKETSTNQSQTTNK